MTMGLKLSIVCSVLAIGLAACSGAGGSGTSDGTETPPVTTLATGLTNPGSIAVDATSVYWTEFFNGTVKKVGLNGGPVTTLASGQNDAYFMAIDSSSVYWTENNNNGTVKKVAK